MKRRSDMNSYDRDLLRYEIKSTEEKLNKLKNIPKGAKLIVSSMGDNLVAYELEDGTRVYF